MLYNLFEVIADHLSDHMNQIFKMFLVTLNDPESLKVRVTTLQYLYFCNHLEPWGKLQILLNLLTRIK